MTLPKIPDHLMILGERFRVEVEKDLMSGEELVSGETLGQYRRIRISADLDNTRQWETLLHEYVHGVLHVIGIGNFMNTELEEVVAQSMEHAMCQLLRAHGTQIIKALGKQGAV